MSLLNFLKIAFKDYRIVGAFTPSSKFLVQSVVKQLPSHAKVIVEYGAGDGVLTKELLKAIPKDGAVIAIEKLKTFTPYLEAVRDPRLKVILSDAATVLKNYRQLNLPKADAVVSNIPFSLWSEQERLEIVRLTQTVLTPDGVFIVFQNWPIIVTALRRYFRAISWKLELRNLTPYFILSASNPKSF